MVSAFTAFRLRTIAFLLDYIFIFLYIVVLVFASQYLARIWASQICLPEVICRP